MRPRGMLPMARGTCRESPVGIRSPTDRSIASAGMMNNSRTGRSSSSRNHHKFGGTSSGSTTGDTAGRRPRRIKSLRGLGCAGSWCKPQVLSPTDPSGSSSAQSVSVMAADMLQRGWVTREEYTKLLRGDRLYNLQEAAEEQPQRRQGGLVRKLSKKSPPNIVRGIRARSKARKRKTVIGAARVPKAVEKKTEHPVYPCRDPITLDDLGSWTWDFHASEAATPPVSCGGTIASSKGGGSGGGGGEGAGVDVCKKEKAGGKGRRGARGGARVGGGPVSSNAVVTYNVESLVLYLLESGDFQEPTTRRPFSLVQLADLDALAARAGAKVKGSLVTSYQEGQAKYREQRERREMLVGADRCLGDVVSEMLSTIEDSEDPHEEAHVYLVTLFPQFAHIFSELKEADEEFARQCLDQYKGTLIGPPNHPTLEQGGLLRTALEFLSEQGGGGGNSDDLSREGDEGGVRHNVYGDLVEGEAISSDVGVVGDDDEVEGVNGADSSDGDGDDVDEDYIDAFSLHSDSS